MLKTVISAFIIASFYLVLTTYLMNGSLVKDTILGDFPLAYKVDLLLALLQGMWTAMNGLGLAVLILIAILTGINLTLVFQRIKQLKSAGKLHFMVGGSSLLGIIGSGCAACGLPVLALLGLSGSVAYLPLRGTEFSIMAALLLILSFYLMIKTNNQKLACAIK